MPLSTVSSPAFMCGAASVDAVSVGRERRGESVHGVNGNDPWLVQKGFGCTPSATMGSEPPRGLEELHYMSNQPVSL
jgi:hypothetical protein